MWAPVLQISPCTGKSPVATPPEGCPCVKGICSEALFCEVPKRSYRRLAQRPSSLSTPARGQLAATASLSACAPGRQPRRRGEAGRGGARGFYLSRRCPPSAGWRSPRSADPEPTRAPAGTPGAERWVPPHPARSFRCRRESAELQVSRPGTGRGLSGQCPEPAYCAALPCMPGL